MKVFAITTKFIYNSYDHNNNDIDLKKIVICINEKKV